jgi:hypothetical protein
MSISDKTIQDIKLVSNVDVIVQYTALKRHGGEYRGLCPFHDERTPSFYVHPKKGYKCFGCDAKGFDAVSFIMNYEKKAYPEALIHIASMAGIAIEYNEGNTQTQQPIIKRKSITLLAAPISFIPVDVFKASLQSHENNHFVNYLIGLFGVDITSKLVSRYFIATSKHWSGATVFWQIDTQGKVRTGKIMLYSPTTGKRVKNLEPPVYWVHKALKQPVDETRQCLFGEHLLIDKTKPVAIVESEKTAIIASAYLPQFIWVAVGGVENLNSEKCSVLKKRNITLFPDLKAFDKWNIKAKGLSQIARFQISDLLECKATEAERKQGLDLADYLVKFNYKEFVSIQPAGHYPVIQPLSDTSFKEIEKTILQKLNLSTHYSLEQFQTLALNHFKLYFMCKNKVSLKLKYLSLWADGMKPLLNDAGISQTQFLNSINFN